MNIEVLISFEVGLGLGINSITFLQHSGEILLPHLCVTLVTTWFVYDKKSIKSGASNSKQQKAFLSLS